MNKILPYLLFYVSFIHYLAREVMVFFAHRMYGDAIAYYRFNRKEIGYFAWEHKMILLIYFLPFALLFVSTYLLIVSVVVCIFVALKRSIEHIG